MKSLVFKLVDLSKRWPFIIMHHWDYTNLLVADGGEVIEKNFGSSNKFMAKVGNAEIHIRPTSANRPSRYTYWVADRVDVVDVPPEQQFRIPNSEDARQSIVL
jgi:hypothetical protein